MDRTKARAIATPPKPQGLTKLLLALGESVEFNSIAIELGISVEFDSDGIAINRGGKFLGVWIMENTAYAWVPSAYLLPSARFERIRDAVRATVIIAKIQSDHLCPIPLNREDHC